MVVVFRCDAARHIGTGHVMRCLTLATEMRSRGMKVYFLCRNFIGNLAEEISSQGFKVALIGSSKPDQNKADFSQYKNWLTVSQETDAAQCISTLEEWQVHPDWIVTDHYALDIYWETELHQHYGSRFLIIDDLANRDHIPCWLLDQTWQRHHADYQKHITPATTPLFGAPFMLLRPEFARLRKQASKGAKGSARLLINLGGGNPDQQLEKVLNLLTTIKLPEDLTIDLAVGASVSIDGQLRELISQLPVTLHHPAKNMAELMSLADFAIGALGTTTWERCSLGLPSIGICLVENQSVISQKLAATGAVHILDKNYSDSQFYQAWELLAENTRFRERMSRKALRICDAKGAPRVAELISRAELDAPVLRLATSQETDIQAVFQWQCLPETRKYARNPNPPSWPEHRSWMLKQLDNKDCHFYFIHKGETDAGVIRLNRQSDNNYEVSIFIDPVFYGQGLAQHGLAFLSQLHPDLNILAFVMPENRASVKLFEKAGYIHDRDNWYKYPATM